MVIVILGVLSTFVIIRLIGGEKGARDARRKSDLKQYQTILETFASDTNNYYPSRTFSGTKRISDLCTDLGITNCVNDPTTGSTYYYGSNGTGSGTASATIYLLWAKMEKPTTNVWFVLCSDGRSGEVTTEPTSFNCPL